MRFFLYGTLMDPDIYRRVTGRPLAPDCLGPAVLAGWRRRRLHGRHYPMVMRAPALSTTGLVVAGLDEQTAHRLVWYENVGYRIRRVHPLLADGEVVAAWMFAPSASLASPGGPWDLASWQRRWKRRMGLRIAAQAPPGPRQMREARALWRRRSG